MKNVMGATLVGITRRLPSAAFFERRRMRRQASPADRAGQAEVVEPFGIVIGHSSRENVALPGIRRNFEALHLAQHLQRAALAAHLRAGSDVLPAQQPAHELRRVTGSICLRSVATVRR